MQSDIPKNLLWLDLEMTGLEAAKDRVIEVAVILTHFDLKEIARYESGIYHDENEIRNRMLEQEFFINRPTETEQMVQTSLSGKPENQAEQEILELITNHFGDEPVYLAGNSIHMDRTFIKQWWPELHARLHYRMLDVSSFKLWYIGNGTKPFVKKEAHTALSDIEESIAELKYYVNN